MENLRKTSALLRAAHERHYSAGHHRLRQRDFDLRPERASRIEPNASSQAFNFSTNTAQSATTRVLSRSRLSTGQPRQKCHLQDFLVGHLCGKFARDKATRDGSCLQGFDVNCLAVIGNPHSQSTIRLVKAD